MTSIASPRETSVNGRRIPIVSTPTSSSRPSLENPRSSEASPNRAPPGPKRARTALREYYNLQNQKAAEQQLNESASEVSSIHDYSEVQETELDREGFDAESYIKDVLENQSLGDLLKTYNGILTDIRALDAEKKALVYDNYSKLIAATETIRKMRANMDPLNPMAKNLDPAIASIYERANRIKEVLRGSMDEASRREMEMSREERREKKKRDKVREVVRGVLDMPERVRGLVEEGRMEDARQLWRNTLRILEEWQEKGVGGEDVQDCIDDGEAALRGDPPNEKSWVNLRGAEESKS
jgi:hypothetical protein